MVIPPIEPVFYLNPTRMIQYHLNILKHTTKISGMTTSIEIDKMRLTEKETVLAENLLSCYEKRTASWPRRRWVWLAIAIAGICSGAYWFLESWIAIKGEASYEITRVIKSGEEPTSEEAHLWAVGSMLKVAKILELRQKMLFFAYLDATGGLLAGLSSACFLGIIIHRWNIDERDALICKVLRAKWQDEVSHKQDEK